MSFRSRVQRHLEVLYPGAPADLAERVIRAVGIESVPDSLPAQAARWSESTCALITYGDSLSAGDGAPLRTLIDSVEGVYGGRLDVVHVLPFFPWSSDDGFSVIDHLAVDRTLGSWKHLEELGRRCTLMADLVVNHLSVSSPWFQQLVRGEEPGRSSFRTADPDDDLSAVVRPRTHELLQAVQTAEGVRHVWCTFSHDQVDLDFSNPEVLIATLRVVDRLVDAGVRWLRLDAVAYVWKEIGTSCIHLPQTHELVKLIHTLLRVREPAAVVVTETNVPHEENVSYLGDGDEASAVYNFSLPPLVTHAVLAETSARIGEWLHALDAPPPGTTFFNFIASHDGLGVRPAEGLLSDAELAVLVDRTLACDGHVAEYSTPAGPRPYELNVSLFDLLGGSDGDLGVARFLAAHTIMLALAGVPALYVHSLLGTPSDHEGVRRRGIPRAINRRKLTVDELEQQLAADDERRFEVLQELLRRIDVRRSNAAFHPAAEQEVVPLGDSVLAVRRGSGDRSVLAITNVTGRPVGLEWARLGVEPTSTIDLLTGLPLSTDVLSIAPYQSVWLSASTAS